MDILFLLIPLSVVLAVAIGVAFWMAVDSGQFDDLEAPAIRVLADDDTPAKKKKPKLNIDDCASFTQLDREEEDGVDFAIASSCEVKLACGIKWTLVCAPGTKQSKKTRGAVAFELDTGGSDGATASAGT